MIMKTLHTIYNNFAKRNLSSLRLWLVMFLTLTVSANVWADFTPGTGYTLVTDVSSLSTNDKVILFCNQNGEGVSGYNGNKDATVSTTAASWIEYLVTKSTNSFTLKDGNKYIANPGGNEFKYGDPGGACTLGSDGLLICNSRNLMKNGNNYRFYATTQSYKNRFYVYKVAVSYAITAQSNNTTYGTVSLSGTTITATPKTGYRVKSGDAGYSIAAGSATVINNGDNTFSVTPSTDCTITINFEVIPTFTVNWYVNGSKEHSQTDVVGTALTNIPNLEDYECEDKVFVGWTTQSSYEHATNAPTDLITNTTGMKIPESGEDYYAVFAEASGDGEEGWQKVTSTDQVKDGEMYAFISFDEAYYLANALSTSDPIVKAVSKTNGILDVTDEMKWIATANNAGFEFKSYSNNNYYLWGGSVNDAIRINTTSTKANATKVWYTKILNTYGVVIYHNASTDGAKYLATYGSSDWRNYLNNTLGNTNRVANLYKFTSGATYSDYTTQCATETAVSLDPNGGTGPMGDVTTKNGTLTLPKCTFTREGYTFAGWATSANGEVAFADEEVVSNWDADITELFAKWTAKTITITWDANGGSVNPTSSTYTYNGATITLPIPTRIGYSFNGWFTATTGGTQITEVGTTNKPIENVTYYAQWTTIEYTITYQETKGATNSNPDTYTIEDEITFANLTDLPKGYNFTGWDPASITKGTTGNKTITAQWTEKALTRYRTDCDACIPLDGYASIDGTYHFFPGETITLTVTPPADAVPYTYQWQKLVGSVWTDIAGATTYTKDAATIADAGKYRCVVSSEGYCDAIAEYDVKCLQLYVYYDNKSDVFNAPLKKVDGATATIDVELQNANYTYYFKITDGCGNWYGLDGDIHSKWCTGVEMNADAYCGLKTTKFGTYVFNVNYSDLTKLTVSVLYPSAYQAADKVIYLDNHVLDWTNSDNAEGKNKIYYRIGRSDHNSKTAMTKVPGTANLYKVTTGEYDNFDVWHIANNGCWSDDGNSIFKTNTRDDWAATQATAFETLPVTSDVVTVTPTDLRSKGGDENNNNCEFYNYDITEGMKTWNAQVVEPTHGTITVKYTHHDGTAVNNFTSGDRDLAHTCLLTITATPVAGYSLASLTVNDVPFTSGNIHTLTADAVIKAIFTINTHVLTWNVNGGNSLTGEYTQGSVDYGTPITPPADPTRAGHTFKGWIDQNGQTTVQTTMPDYDLTYTAQWQINQYTVTLNPNYPAGKTGTFTDKDGNTINGNLELIYDYNTASKTITDLYTSLTLDGYEFGGWYNANGSNPGEVSGSKCTVTDNITGNKTYYAKWTKLYSITLSENGTTKELDPQTSTSYTLPTELSVGTCDNDENELVGWSTVTIPTPGDKPTTNFYDLGETVTLTGDQTTFYAVFAKPNMDAKETSIAGGDMPEGAPGDWVTYGTDTYSNHGVKFDSEGDYILSPSLEGKYSDLLIKLKSGHNGGSGSVLTFYAYKKDNSLFGNDEVTITPTTLTPTDSYTNQKTVYEISIVADEPVQKIMIIMTSKTKNLGMEYCEIFALPQKYFDYTTTCLSKYSITYDFNGGEGNCDNEKVTHGEDYTICDEEPTKAGYTFLYWANGEDTYAPGTTIENVQADITLTATWQEREKYTLTFNDQGDTKEFQHIESLPVEMQEPWADICSGPIQYVFDGWAKSPVNNGTTEYEKVDFSTFTMPAENTTLYAVYRYAEEGSGDDDYHLVEKELTDYSGDYLIVSYDNNYAMSTSDEGKIGTNTYAAYVDISEYYADKIIKSNSTTDTYVFTATKTTNGYSLCCKQNNTYLAILNTSTGTGSVLRYYEESVYNTKLSECEWSIGVGSISNYAHSSYNQYIRWNDNPKRFAIYAPSSVKGIHLYKKGIGTSYIYTSSLICGSITAEDALVTSTKDQKVKVKVPITLESSTGVTIINATSDNAAFDVTGLTDVEAGDHTIVIEYTPAEYNITETANITLSATNGATTTFTVTGRSLPENFVIATKVGATWYALPANMNGATNPEGVVIDVDETNMTAIAPNTTVYTLFPVATVDGNSDRYKEYGERLRFAAVNNGNRGLWANDAKSGTTINNDAKITAANSTAGAAYEWKITTTIVDGNWQYTLQTYQSNNQKYLRYWTAASGGAKWGTYDSGNDKLYFMPVTTYTDLDLEVMEWGTNSMVIRAGEDLPQNVNITINGTTTPKTLQNINGSDLYKIDNVTLTSDDCGTIIIDNGLNARKIIRKPLLVSGNKSGSEYTTSPGRDICAECDIVILNGGKLIADEAKSTGSHVDFANIYVYPGGKLVLNGKSLGVKRQVYLRGGYSWINQTTYDLPEVYVNGDINFNGSANIIYDYYIQNYKYYQFSLPYQVPLANVTDEAGVDNFPVWVKHYNGALRAADAYATSWEWYYGDNFERGEGYIIAAQPRQITGVKDRPLSIIRFPLGNKVFNTTNGLESDLSITTKAHGIDGYKAGTVTANNVGWNFVGNPFLSTWQGDIGHKQLIKHPNDANWDGSYTWADSDVKYITIMSAESGSDYAQYIASKTELQPFFPFFMQETADGGGTINFTAANRIKKAPAELYADEPREAFVQIEILADVIEDQTGIFVSDTYSDDIDFDDYEKMFGSSADKSKLWLVHDNKRMAFEAMTETSAAANIALGYRAPKTGSYTFAINEDVSALNEVMGVYLTDHELGVTDYNLLYNTYEFETEAVNYNDKRFTIRIVLSDDSNGVVTGVDNIGTMKNGIYKFFYQDKLYIMRNGVIYDATGKQVHVINE